MVRAVVVSCNFIRFGHRSGVVWEAELRRVRCVLGTREGRKGTQMGLEGKERLQGVILGFVCSGRDQSASKC